MAKISKQLVSLTSVGVSPSHVHEPYIHLLNSESKVMVEGRVGGARVQIREVQAIMNFK